MFEFLFLLILNSSGNWINAGSTEEPIRIDGVIDKEWENADSIKINKQFYPYYDSSSTYLTTLKVLQDKNNLYFLLRTNFKDYKPRTALSGRVEHYIIYLDPLLSKVQAYAFGVSASGSRWDDLVLDDGRKWEAWDGVWENKLKVFKNRKNEWILIYEVQIPFKNFRFDKSKTEWGFQIATYYQKNRESSYWILPEQDEGLRVSKFGVLKGVQPDAEGIGAEIYPVGLGKNEYYIARDSLNKYGKTSPWIGLDLAYRKGTHSFNLTFFPDFAEIESDPFEMTLGKYEIYYAERRPFFLEGKEVFEPAGFGHMGFYSPTKVFYSRRIGRVMRDGSGKVPILSGIKWIGKIERAEMGILSVLTGEKFGVSDSAYYASWNVLRFKKYIFNNSEVGFLSTYRENLEKNEWFLNLNLDGALRWKKNQVLWQAIGNTDSSNHSRMSEAGYLFKSGGLFYLSDNFYGAYSASYANEHFDISSMGYASVLPGDRGIKTFGGYINFPKKGKISFYNINIGYWQGIEKIDAGWSNSVFLEASINTRKPSAGLHFSMGYGRTYEGLVKYYSRSINQNVWVNIGQFNSWAGYYIKYGWNYRRNFLAYNGNFWGGFYIPLMNRISLNPSLNGWVEFDTTGKHLSTTTSGEIHIGYKFTPFMSISFAPNPVFVYENSEFNLVQTRIALYYSWEIKPRSKLYIVLNQLLNKNGSEWETQERIYAVKLRWLFWF